MKEREWKEQSSPNEEMCILLKDIAADPTVCFKTESEFDVAMQDLEKVLTEQIIELEVNEKSSCETEMYDEVYFDRMEKDNIKIWNLKEK